MAHKRLLVRGLGTLLLWAMGTAHAGEFSYNGLLQTEIAVSTTGDRTQPLDAGTALDNDGRVLNTTALRLELEGTYAFDRRTHVTGRFRLWGDYTNQIDSAYNSDVDLFAGSDYPGNGGLLSLSSKNTIADIPELYFDATRSGFWVRAGKQQIAWGHSIGMRILDDMVSSLDTRRHGGTYGLASEEFLDERIGLFAVRGSWRVPDTEWELEGLISDWAPSFPFVAGSAYANLPGGILVNADDGIDDARDQPVYGLRVKGLVLDGRVDRRPAIRPCGPRNPAQHRQFAIARRVSTHRYDRRRLQLWCFRRSTGTNVVLRRHDRPGRGGLLHGQNLHQSDGSPDPLHQSVFQGR
jgi:hypothetical protein